jgi:hypothetical protein
MGEAAMTAAQAAPPLSTSLRNALLVIAAVLIIVLVGSLIVSARAVAQGWLIAFVIWSGVAIGSLVLLLIHRLTGGRWGDELAATLVPCAAVLPLAALAFVPLAFGLSAPYRWAAGTAGTRLDLLHFYLNQPGFLVRAAVALAGWSALAVLAVRGCWSRLAAAAGLAFHGFILSLVAVDWILSIEVGFGSSAFAAGIAIQQILSALAFAAIVAPEPPSARAAGDLGGLLIATLLGTVYIDLMSFIVSWYGDLPEKAAWYLRRSQNGWNWIILAAVILGALVPFALLLPSRLRTSRTSLRIVGALVLLGVVLHVLWLMAPVFDTGAIAAALVALIALTSLSIAAADPIMTVMRSRRHDG